MAKKWTPSEEKYLLENYGKVPMAELADRFGVTRKAISAKLDKLRQSHGIDPVGARERAGQKTGSRISAAQNKAPQPGGAVPRKIPSLGGITQPDVETMNVAEPSGRMASGVVIKTDKGWHPLFIDKKKVTR